MEARRSDVQQVSTFPSHLSLPPLYSVSLSLSLSLPPSRSWSLSVSFLIIDLLGGEAVAYPAYTTTGPYWSASLPEQSPFRQRFAVFCFSLFASPLGDSIPDDEISTSVSYIEHPCIVSHYVCMSTKDRRLSPHTAILFLELMCPREIQSSRASPKNTTTMRKRRNATARCPSTVLECIEDKREAFGCPSMGIPFQLSD